ncbi:Hypothetical predicted protein [Mytilus galloprovincialis]|uniref:WSC domain-containing protein n=1 Tax=Mytilus galloprovincialis TaxID=29158 RepID=A0A8B6E3W6_MYTGA|nr:Hypothetical predicted protein [Mytilus galloprovincialis]
MTIPYCLSICLVEGHTFAGLRYGTKCYCDSVITKDLTLLQLPNTKCTRPCGGNATQYCGAMFKLALYQLNISSESTSTIERSSSTSMIAPSSTLTTSHFTSPKYTSTGSETPDTTSLINIETTVSVTEEPSASTSTETSALFFTNATSHVSKDTTQYMLFATTSWTPPNNTCSCFCYNVNSPAFKEKVENLIKEVAINKKLTSLYINSKICMSEQRTSSKMIGAVGVLCICVPLVMIVVFDISNCFGRERKYICSQYK